MQSEKADIRSGKQRPRPSLVRGICCGLTRFSINLLNNANKFTPDGGTIRFIIEEVPQKEGRHSGFSSGSQRYRNRIEEENLEKIFGEFEREIDSTVNRVEGSGLGLAIAKVLLSRWDGRRNPRKVPLKGNRFLPGYCIPDSADSAGQNPEGGKRKDFRVGKYGRRAHRKTLPACGR